MKIDKKTVKKIMAMETREEQTKAIKKIAKFPDDVDCGYFVSDYPYTDSLVVNSTVNFENQTTCFVLERLNINEWYEENGEISFKTSSFGVMISRLDDKNGRVFLISNAFPVVVEGSIDVSLDIKYEDLFTAVEKAINDGVFFPDFSEENLNKIIEHYASEEKRIKGTEETLSEDTVSILKSVFELARSGSSMDKEIDKFIENQEKKVILPHEQ
jgi:hypothetical protein